MAKGIIYIMTTAVPGLIKIGKTGSETFEQRMYNLEHNGYRNVTAMKRTFAIQVDDYDEKETLLHTIFAKSQVSDTELFALDVNIAIQLLSSFDGDVVYPKTEKKEEIFEEATESAMSKLIPDGKYVFIRKKKGEEKVIHATAVIKEDVWTILKGSNLGMTEGKGGSQKAKILRASSKIDENGVLQEDVELGVCTPSFAGVFVLNAAVDGWTGWYDENQRPIDVYRPQKPSSED